jgi:hypothetical protein
MVLLILVVLWLVVLTPHFVRKWLDRHPAGSIESFHEQLHLLERTGPKIVPAAYRLETAQPSTGLAAGQSGYPAISSMPARPNLVLLQPVGAGGAGADEVVDEVSGEHYRRLPPAVDTTPAAPLSAAPRVEEIRRRRVRRRRRDLVLGLVATGLLTGLAGIAPSLHPLWALTGVAVVALAAFVGLAAYAQFLQLETEPGRSPRHAAGRPGGPRPAVGGYPGAWDEDAYFDDEGYEPQRAVAGR